MVSEKGIIGEWSLEQGNIRDMVPQSFAYQHVYSAGQRSRSENDIERTFSFAIKVLSVSKNSPAVQCDVLCWSSFLVTAAKSL
jgi:hypothetical protein